MMCKVRRLSNSCLLYVCPHTPICVSSYYYMRVLILLYMCPHTTMSLSCLLYVCPHTAYSIVLILLYVVSYYCICVLMLLCLFHACSMCVLILLYVSTYCYTCVLIRLYICPHTATYVCPHTAIHMSSYCCICGLQLRSWCRPSIESQLSYQNVKSRLFSLAAWWEPIFSLFFLLPPHASQKPSGPAKEWAKNGTPMGLRAKNIRESRVRELCLLCFISLV